MSDVVANFPLCGGCSRRKRYEGMKDDEYYCPIADGILQNGYVTDDTDATNCIRNGWYERAQNYTY